MKLFPKNFGAVVPVSQFRFSRPSEHRTIANSWPRFGPATGGGSAAAEEPPAKKLLFWDSGASGFQYLTVEPEVRTGIRRSSPNAAPFTRWILLDIYPAFFLTTDH